jgi:YkoY family integral membrane protein
MNEYIQQIIDNPLPCIGIILNLVVIESLLSVDNAAVLATMVMDLPKKQRGKALRYGILGAYIFRGLALLFASYLIQFWYLKPLGGMYLLYLVFDWWKTKQTKTTKDDILNKERNWLYRSTVGIIGNFWATVAMIEIMDLAFSIDNVFVVVAFTNNIVLVWLGVFIGILAMRLVAQGFVKLMEKIPMLETAAFVVIGVLGVKLLLSVFEHFFPQANLSLFLTSHAADWGTSILTALIFLVPIVWGYVIKKEKS